MVNQHTQTLLCDAIRKLVLVSLKYDDDLVARTYAPHIVYYSSNRNELVDGTQFVNPAEPLERNKPRIFNLSKITSVQLTDEKFVPLPSFDRNHTRYRHGIICSV